MPKVQIAHNSTLQAPEAYTKLKAFFDQDETLKKLDSKMTATYDDKSMTGQVKGSQFKADVSVVSQDKGSQIKVVVDLPLLLTPFKGKIEETLKKMFQKNLA